MACDNVQLARAALRSRPATIDEIERALIDRYRDGEASIVLTRAVARRRALLYRHRRMPDWMALFIFCRRPDNDMEIEK